MTEKNTSFAEETTAIPEDATVEIVEIQTFAPGQSNVDNMVDTLPYMGKGLLGIFLVTVIIIACVAILNKTTSPKKKKEEQ